MEKVVAMNMQFIALALVSLFSFSLGRTFGRIETTLSFNHKMQSLISALKKVDTLAALRGEDVSKLSTDEIVRRTKKQLESEDDTNG